jgi:hypothetical protein
MVGTVEDIADRTSIQIGDFYLVKIFVAWNGSVEEIMDSVQRVCVVFVVFPRLFCGKNGFDIRVRRKEGFPGFF